jgi:VWFA-related protein
MRRVVGSMLVAAVLAAGSPIRAQEPEGEVGGAFTDVVDVQAVDVEVVVTDRRGRRVSGLTAQDFRLLVDGKPVPLDTFAEVRDGRAVAAVAAPGSGEPREVSLPADLGAGEAVGTHYLIFVDEFFSPFSLRNEALKVLARDLQTLGPQDRIAVVAFDGRRLRILSDWNEPSTGLAALLREAARRKGYLTAADFSTLEDIRPLRVTGDVIVADGSMQPMERESAMLENLMIRQVVATAAGALRSLEPPPGRKVALLLSGGWNFDPRSGLDYAAIQETQSIRGGFSILRPLTDAANLLGYTVYPIHLAGSSLPSAGDQVGEAPAAFTAANRSMTVSGRESGLVFSAEETGGRFLKAGASHLRKIAEDTRSYYWLGFSTAESDNRRRDLKVEVVRDGLEVRSRSSFVPMSRAVRTSMEVEAALLTGRSRNSGALEVATGMPEERGPLTATVPLTLRIPAQAITFLPDQGRFLVRLEMRVAAIGKYGDTSETALVPIAFAVETVPGAGQNVVYQTRIAVRRGKQDVQIAVTDAASGQTLSARLPLEL